MRTIAKLFGRSPFVPMQTHMEKVAECVARVIPITEAFLSGDMDTVEKLAKEISKLEHVADETKHDIQNGLRKGMFLAVDRGKLLQIISLQDGIADKTENFATLLTIKALKCPDGLKPNLIAFRDKNLEAFNAAHEIVKRLDELLESSFGGAEAQQVAQMVHHVAVLEHEADLIQRDLLKGIFAHEQEYTHGEFYLWLRLFRQIGEIANLSETLANRIRSTLELK
ncbi:TIGR00153 family protein [Poriferisphaera sp. WC338]|uniref:TIGR00153 family protein n=1 Tax=Poriferisphaera sp. WC338 TaxID=3425129 RepID=UPI003D812B88